VSKLGRRAATVLAVAVAVPGLAACGAGPDAITNMPYSPSDGINATVGASPIRVLNALVVAGADGETGTVSLTIADAGDKGDQLIGLSAGEGTEISFEGSQEIPPGQTLTLGPGEPPGGESAQATVLGLQTPAGATMPLTLAFQNAGEVTIRTVVVAADGYYADYTVAPPATTAPSAPVDEASPDSFEGQTDVDETPAPTNS
jgi:copper(I)-binding protein